MICQCTVHDTFERDKVKTAGVETSDPLKRGWVESPPWLYLQMLRFVNDIKTKRRADSRVVVTADLHWEIALTTTNHIELRLPRSTTNA